MGCTFDKATWIFAEHAQIPTGLTLSAAQTNEVRGLNTLTRIGTLHKLRKLSRREATDVEARDLVFGQIFVRVEQRQQNKPLFDELFNRLTGSTQKVANYAGVTVERKEGHFTSAAGNSFVVIDLPGTYSLSAVTPDERITRQVLLGERGDEKAPDAIVLVLNATNLRLNLMLAMEVIRLGRPTVVALNMMDAAARLGMKIDVARLSQRLGVPVIETIAVQSGGVAALVSQLDHLKSELAQGRCDKPPFIAPQTQEQLQVQVGQIMAAAVQSGEDANRTSDRIDADRKSVV